MKKILISSLVLLMSGCASVKYNGPDVKYESVDFPKIGTVANANLGDNLIKKGLIANEKVLKVNETVDGALYQIPQSTYKQLGFDEKFNYYSSIGVVRKFFADPHKALAVDKEESSRLCVITVFNVNTCYSANYEIKNITSLKSNSFQQALIYNGRVGNKINIGYREFSSNLARPAFHNDVEYDLSLSNIIGYKGAQLEIIKADNTGITYRVISNFP